MKDLNFFLDAIDVIGCLITGRLFVGGHNVRDVLKKGAELKKKGYSVTYNLLGEHIKDPREAYSALVTTMMFLHEMDASNRGNVAIKPSLYGLEVLSKEEFYNCIDNLVDLAMAKGVEIEFDAENSALIPATFEIFSRFASRFPHKNFVRQCVQAHLANIFDLMDEYNLWDKNIRVVKGADVYDEPRDVVIWDDQEVMARYYEIVRRNYSVFGQLPYVATIRDGKVPMRVEETLAKNYLRPYRPPIEMLYGPLGRRLSQSLLARGHDVRMYTPFTANKQDMRWFSYGVRRAATMRRLIIEEIKNKVKFWR